MKKTLIAACAVAALAASLPMEAQAQWRRGPGPGAGIAAGIIAGTMLGAAAASASQPRYYYDAPPAYIVDEPRRCWWERQWVENDYGDMVRRRVRVCDR